MTISLLLPARKIGKKPSCWDTHYRHEKKKNIIKAGMEKLGGSKNALSSLGWDMAIT